MKPGTSRTHVGGSHGTALVVAVSARAVEGQATAQSLKAVAQAVGLRPRQVTLIRGEKSRDKTIALTVAAESSNAVIAQLRELGAGSIQQQPTR